MPEPIYPSLYQINTRVWLTDLSRARGRPATLDDVPDAELDRVTEMGFDWLWLLSVWRTGPAGQRVSRTNPEWRREFEETLPDLRDEDIAGSGFAITGYSVHPALGGDEALARLREHLRAGLDLQNRLARFLENHDEPRAAATFAPGMHEAAGVITYLSPGLRFFHQGQLGGSRKRISPHLVRSPEEPPDGALNEYHSRLLAVIRQSIVREGQWRLLECTPAWEGNWTWECFVAWSWSRGDGQRRLMVVNYAGNQSQCYVRLPFPELSGHVVRLTDLTGPARYDRAGSDLVSQGLYLDLPPWGYHVFEVTTV